MSAVHPDVMRWLLAEYLRPQRPTAAQSIRLARIWAAGAELPVPSTHQAKRALHAFCRLAPPQVVALRETRMAPPDAEFELKENVILARLSAAMTSSRQVEALIRGLVEDQAYAPSRTRILEPDAEIRPMHPRRRGMPCP